VAGWMRTATVDFGARFVPRWAMAEYGRLVGGIALRAVQVPPGTGDAELLGDETRDQSSRE
jgi:hypothetical protein